MVSQLTTYSSDWPFNSHLKPISDFHSTPYSRPYDVIKNSVQTTSGKPTDYSGGKSFKRRTNRRLKRRKTRKSHQKVKQRK